MVVLIGLSFAEVSTMYDRTGGPLIHAEEAMGKTASCTVGWPVWCLSPTKTGTTAGVGLQECGVAARKYGQGFDQPAEVLTGWLARPA